MFQPAFPHDETNTLKGHEEDGFHGPTVSACEAHVRAGFLRKVFGIVATQLAVTAVMCALAANSEAT